MKLKSYLPELVVFGFVLAVLLIDLNPDYTFINKAADSIGYIYSASYLYPSYHTSPPLYLLISHLFLMLPFGTEAWRMGLFSVLSTMGACVFIYLILRNLLDKRTIRKYDQFNKINSVNENRKTNYYALLGVLVYGLSALVVSQSVIVNTYATTCMLASGVYYFIVTKHWKLVGLMIGIGFAIHLLMGFVFLVVFLGYRQYRRNWKALLISFSFIVFYAYIPLTNREPFMWLPDPESVNTIWATITDTIAVINMLIGSLSIWDLPKRILDIIGVIGVSIGVITIVPIIYYFRKTKFWHNPLFWFMLVPIILFMGELDMNTFDYMMLAMPFFSIVICLGLAKMVDLYKFKAKVFVSACTVVVIGMGVFNCVYFDIGNTLDPNLSATKLYREEFNKIPDGAIFMPNYAWEWESIYKYNMDNNKHIYPICIDVLPSEMYQQKLIKDGIKLDTSLDENVIIKASEMAKSIALLNDNVWTTQVYDAQTFGTYVVKATPDIVANVDREKIKQISTNPQIAWKPYNPYKIMDTSLFISDWSYILYSNYNLRLFGGLASIGLILTWLYYWVTSRKDNKCIENGVGKDK